VALNSAGLQIKQTDGSNLQNVGGVENCRQKWGTSGARPGMVV